MNLQWTGTLFKGAFKTLDARGGTISLGSVTLAWNGSQLAGNWISTDGRRGSLVLRRQR